MESWKDVFVTYTDRDVAAHVSRLKPHPNRSRLYNWYDEGLILAGGDWFDRMGYNQPALMGHCFQVFANVTKRQFNLTYPLLETYLSKLNDGTVKCMKDGGATTLQPQITMVNEYFPSQAAKAESNISGCKWTKDGECLGFGHYLYIARTTVTPGLV